MAKKERKGKGKNKEVQEVQEQIVDLETYETYVPNEENAQVEVKVTKDSATSAESAKAGEVVVDYDNSLPVAEAIKANNQDQPSENKKGEKKDSKKTQTQTEKKKYSFSDFMKSSESISIPESVKTFLESNWDVFGTAMEKLDAPVPSSFDDVIPNNTLVTVLTKDIEFDFDGQSLVEPTKNVFIETFMEIEQNLHKNKNVNIADTIKGIEEGLENILLNKGKGNLLKIGIIDSKLSKDTEDIHASEMYNLLGVLSVCVHKDDLTKLKENFVKAALDPENKVITIEQLILLTV